MLVQAGLDNKYERIYNGDKLRYTYLLEPNSSKGNVIAFPDKLPVELGLHKHVDYNTQFEKSYLKPLRPIFAAAGWSPEYVPSLKAFF